MTTDGTSLSAVLFCVLRCFICFCVFSPHNILEANIVLFTPIFDDVQIIKFIKLKMLSFGSDTAIFNITSNLSKQTNVVEWK